MDFKDLKELIRFVDKSGVVEFEYEKDDMRVYINKSAGVVMAPAGAAQYAPAPVAAAPVAAAPAAPVAAAATASDLPAGGIEITSPIIGTFYGAPAPGAPSFVTEGQIVEAGQTLCIVEAMKIMNEIEAEFKCKILKIVGVNGQPVEYGQPIFIVEKA